MREAPKRIDEVKAVSRFLQWDTGTESLSK